MTISEPRPGQMAQLRALWKAAFGDNDEFLDMFYSRGYSPRRCRCIQENGRVTAVLYWFDCACGGQALAYIYAVATDPACRNRGLCRRLMADTAEHLKALGYAGILLLPQDEGLRQMYGKMGYEPATSIREFTCLPDAEPLPLRELAPAEYASLRRTLLPPGSVIQEGENLAYLSGYARFYSGSGILAAAFRDGNALICCELLGDEAKAPGLLRALGAESGTFRCPGTGKDFAMYLPLADSAPAPRYFAFAFD